MPDLLTTLIQVGLPTLAGGGLTAMYMKWKLARLDDDRARKIALVALWRAKLVEQWSNEDQMHGRGFDFMSKPEFFLLKPHLSEAFLTEIDQRLSSGFLAKVRPNAEGRALGTITDFPRSELADEIGRIEREWQLLG